jgi:uncharacterized membrane protein
MEKTKLGLSIGVLGAVLYLLGLFSGYIATILVAGYVLLCENNAWLKKTALRAVFMLLAFSLLSTVVGLIPDLINFVDNICNIFKGHFTFNFATNVINVLRDIIGFAEIFAYVFLAFTAIKQKDIKLPIIDKLIEKENVTITNED